MQSVKHLLPGDVVQLHRTARTPDFLSLNFGTVTEVRSENEVLVASRFAWAINSPVWVLADDIVAAYRAVPMPTPRSVPDITARAVPKYGTQAYIVLHGLASGYNRLAHLSRRHGVTIMNETSASARIRELRKGGWRITGQKDKAGGWSYTLHELDVVAFWVAVGADAR